MGKKFLSSKRLSPVSLRFSGGSRDETEFSSGTEGKAFVMKNLGKTKNKGKGWHSRLN